MDYDRNSFAKNIEGLATLYDVRYAYNKHKECLHNDEGLKQKFITRLNFLGERSTCPLMNSALEEILENLEEPLPITVKKKHIEVPEDAEDELLIKKKRPSIFKDNSNNLEDFFYKKTETENVLEEITLEVIKKSLEVCDFNLTKSAKQLGISSRTLRTKIQDIKDKETLCTR